MFLSLIMVDIESSNSSSQDLSSDIVSLKEKLAYGFGQ